MLMQDLDGNKICMGYFSTMTTNTFPKLSRVDKEDAAKSEAPNSAGEMASSCLPTKEGGVQSQQDKSKSKAKSVGLQLFRDGETVARGRTQNVERVERMRMRKDPAADEVAADRNKCGKKDMDA